MKTAVLKSWTKSGSDLSLFIRMPYLASNMRILLFCLLLVSLSACYQPERDCQKFRNGTFSFTTILNEDTVTTRFIRQDTLEIDYYEGRADSSSIRWVNDCEFIVQKLKPRNRAEKQAILMKILSTTENSYTFEYGLIGQPPTGKGTALKTD